MKTDRPATQRFFHLVLRTLDEAAARAFYSAVLGVRGDELIAFPLHETAVARGARPHWLGFIDVDDLSASVATFTERGGSALGPRWVSPQGLEATVMRDPGGAVVALSKAPLEMPKQPFEVAWYFLNTSDLKRARKTYGELFGWDFRAPSVLSGQRSVQPFAWQPGEPEVGAMSDIGGRPEIHPHWNFFMHVASLERAVAEVRQRGGLIVTELTLANGDRVAVCDDPQGAAFALTNGSIRTRSRTSRH